MERHQPDPHDVPGFSCATGVDDPTPRHEYRDEPAPADPADRVTRQQQTATVERGSPAEGELTLAEHVAVAADLVTDAEECTDPDRQRFLLETAAEHFEQVEEQACSAAREIFKSLRESTEGL